MKNNRRTIGETIKRLELRFGQVFTVDYMAGRARIENACGRQISPRLSVGEMALWLDGFEAGLDEMERK